MSGQANCAASARLLSAEDWGIALRQAGPLPDYMVIDGVRVGRESRDAIEVLDPAIGQVIGCVPAGTAADVDRAAASSRRAYRCWSRAKPVERARILYRAAEAIRRQADRLSIVEVLDCGKPLREARADVETAARYFEYYAGIADKLQGDSIPLGPDYMSFTLHEPVGVTAHIVPWNFPLVQVARGVAPALAAGNTVVVKPAEQTPHSAIILVDLLGEAGLPKGVYSVLTGYGPAVGGALCSHPEVNHVTFTGSVRTGKAVMTAAATHVASVTLELGGKSPVVVLEDADIDAAVAGTVKAICLNAGQVCSAGSRLVVQKSVKDQVVEGICEKLSGMTVGHGLANPDIGPIVSAEQLELIDGMVTAATQRGAHAVIGSGRMKLAGAEEGFFYAPTVLMAQDVAAIEVQEEIFGPVLTVQAAEDAEEALHLANATNYGLVAGIYTRDVDRALALARDLEAGQVFINEYFAGGVETPFGGVKQSGFGREKGLDALRSYLRVKCVTARISP